MVKGGDENKSGYDKYCNNMDEYSGVEFEGEETITMRVTFCG